MSDILGSPQLTPLYVAQYTGEKKRHFKPLVLYLSRLQDFRISMEYLVVYFQHKIILLVKLEGENT